VKQKRLIKKGKTTLAKDYTSNMGKVIK